MSYKISFFTYDALKKVEMCRKKPYLHIYSPILNNNDPQLETWSHFMRSRLDYFDWFLKRIYAIDELKYKSHHDNQYIFCRSINVLSKYYQTKTAIVRSWKAVQDSVSLIPLPDVKPNETCVIVGSSGILLQVRNRTRMNLTNMEILVWP